MSANHSVSRWQRLRASIARLPRRIVRPLLLPVAQHLSGMLDAKLREHTAAIQHDIEKELKEMTAAIHRDTLNSLETLSGEMTLQLSAYYQDVRANGSGGKSEVLIKLENLEREFTALLQRIEVMNQIRSAPNDGCQRTAAPDE